MRYFAIILFFLSSSAQASEWYLGGWEVTDAKFPGISAMGLDEAKVWFGSIATYTKEKVSFRKETCESPVFAIEKLTEEKFYTSYRASFQELGIKGKSVEILKVGCPNDWVEAGSTFIKGSSKFGYTLWDGVFFELSKIAP